MSSSSAGWEHCVPCPAPGPAKISGTWVERSQSEFLPVMAFSPRCQRVVGPEHDDGIVPPARRVERVQHAADLAVHEGRACQVGAHERTPLVGLLQPRQARLGQLPMQIPRELRHVVAVALLHRRKDDLVFRREPVEPLLRGKARHVRQAEPDGEEERLLRRQRLHLGNGSVGDLPVRLLMVVLGIHAPVHGPHLVGSVHELRRRQRHAGSGSPDVELVCAQPLWDRAVVEDLAEAGGEIAVPREILRQRDALACARHLANARHQAVDAGGRGPQPRQQTRARGIAQWRLAMRVPEQSAARRQAVHVRRLRLGMAAEAADPVIQVVYGDEEDIGFGDSWTQQHGRSIRSAPP